MSEEIAYFMLGAATGSFFSMFGFAFLGERLAMTVFGVLALITFFGFLHYDDWETKHGVGD